MSERKPKTIWKFIYNIGLTRSGLWLVTTELETRYHIFCIEIVEHNFTKNKALSISILNFGFIIGII